MYLSVCKKDFNDIEKGALLDTYQRANYIYVKERESEQDFQGLSLHEYSSYFNRFADHTFLPYLEEQERRIGFLRLKKKSYYEKRVAIIRFNNVHFEDLKRMQLSIIEPLEQLYEVGGIENHTEVLYKELMKIEELQKASGLFREDIQHRIDNAESIVRKLSTRLGIVQQDS